MFGPRSDPPIPTFTMSVIFLFVDPLVFPDKISLVNFLIFCLSERSSLPISEFKLNLAMLCEEPIYFQFH